MKTQHCCEQINDLLKEDKVSIYYYDEWREYAVGMKNGTSAVQAINFCPWCGTKLPHSLSDEWFDVLKREYALSEPAADKRKIPKEFKSDLWWKKRGL